MLYLDYLAYNNALKNVSVAEKLLLSGGGLVLALALPRPAVQIALAAVMHAVMLAARIPPRYILRLWLGPLAFLAVGLAAVAVSVGGDAPLFALAGVRAGPLYLAVTAGGLETARDILLRSIAAVSCLLMLAATTPVAGIIAYSFRVPGLRPVGEIALLTYRFIFVFLAAAGQIYTAQQSRLGYADNRRSLRSLAVLAANVGRKAFVTARDLSLSMAARNYQGRLAGCQADKPVKPLRLAAIVAALAAVAAAALI